MANYAPSTRARIADIITGMRVDTAVLSANSYMITGPTSTEGIFNIYGRIKVMHLFFEVITDLSAQACVLYFTATFSTPAETVQPISSVGASMSGLLRGGRYSCIGITAAQATLIDAQEGISPVIMKEKMILGAKGGTGQIGINTATATIATGTIRFSLFYVPMSDGAYATNAV
jgi:hypothetical protein